MVYVPPTLANLRVKVARDLRDSALTTFVAAQLTDYINEGIAELNRVRPPEKVLQLLGDAALTNLPFDYVFMVETAVRRTLADPYSWVPLPPDVAQPGHTRTGWTYFANTLYLAPGVTSHMASMVTRFTAAQTHLAIWGYGQRDLVLADANVPQFIDGADEMAVGMYARMRGYQALAGDRMLFAQWQAAANNADVSATQMMGMISTAEQEWERQRKRMYVIRRPAVG